MPQIPSIKSLFDEQHEVMAWAIFLVALGSTVFRGLDGWTVVLFALALVTMGVVKVKSAGPSGVVFNGDDVPQVEEER